MIVRKKNRLKARSVIRLGVIVGVFSIINGVVIQAIEKK